MLTQQPKQMSVICVTCCILLKNEGHVDSVSFTFKLAQLAFQLQFADFPLSLVNGTLEDIPFDFCLCFCVICYKRIVGVVAEIVPWTYIKLSFEINSCMCFHG